MSTVEQQALPTSDWKSDPIHSSVGFSVRHNVVGRFRGQFKDYDIRLHSHDGELSIEGTVKIASVDIDDENLYPHLLSPDFFDNERHPELTFKSTSVRRDGEDLVVEGDLTLKGVTQRVEGRGTLTGPGTGIGGNEALGLELETTIDRTAFGLSWNAPLPKGGLTVSNDVKLDIALELTQEQ
jgi:polyisoprenoid-binding protein YceI